jgi:predicted CopG family antitoxin
LPLDAHNVKISDRAWQLLRWAKHELGVKSYSEVIRTLDEQITDSSKKLQQSLKTFDVERHRIKTKTPDESGLKSSQGPKTILLQMEARKILNRLKLESNRADYTFSDAIDFLVEISGVEIPERLKK